MSTELATTDIAATVKQRIQAEFVNLIPDEVWAETVQRELQWFTTDTNASTWRNNETRPSPLRCLIRASLEELATVRLKDELSKPEYHTYFNGSEMEFGDAIRDVVKASAAEIWQAAVGQVVSKAIMDFQNNLNNNY